jgi:hypothetical protein
VRTSRGQNRGVETGHGHTEKLKHAAQGVRKIQADPATEKRMTLLISELGQARRDFASVVRTVLGVDSPEVVLSETPISQGGAASPAG